LVSFFVAEIKMFLNLLRWRKEREKKGNKPLSKKADLGDTYQLGRYRVNEQNNLIQ